MCTVSKKPLRRNEFAPGTQFDFMFDIYLFDKKLRQLMLDAIERIEVHVRSVIAHEVGYHDPMAYQNVRFINPSQTKSFNTKQGRQRNIWTEWLKRQNDQMSAPVRTALNGIDSTVKPCLFGWLLKRGTLEPHRSTSQILKDTHRNRISRRLGLTNAKILKEWLQEINTLRNRCAHHSRIRNKVSTNPLPIAPNAPYFQNLALDSNATTRLYGLIAVLWYFVKAIGENSQWINQVADVIDSKPAVPGCPFAARGLPDETGFPRKLFGI